MNSGITISFIIGGLLLVSILAFNNRVSQYSSNSTLDLAVKNRIETIAELITNDFQKIGYNLPSNTKPFVIVQEQKVQFKADTFFDDNRPFSQIQWEFHTNKPYTDSSNPNDYELTRADNATTGFGNSEIVFPATFFKIEYMDSNGNIIANLPADKDLIRQVRVEIICESTESASVNNSGEPIYPKAVWSKTFYPPNLQYQNQ